VPDKHKTLNTTNLKAVAFDWDNTLALSHEALVRSVNVVLAVYGMGDWETVKEKRNPILSFRDNFPLIFGRKANEAYELYRQVYMQKAAELISAPECATEVLQYLLNKNIKIVLVTNKDRALLEYELPLLYPQEWFTRIVCGHEAPHDKPNPEQLIYALDGLVPEISEESVWMVGDSTIDSTCALSCDAKAIRIGEPIWDIKCEDETNEKITFFADFAKLLKALKG